MYAAIGPYLPEANLAAARFHGAGDTLPVPGLESYIVVCGHLGCCCNSNLPLWPAILLIPLLSAPSHLAANGQQAIRGEYGYIHYIYDNNMLE